MFSGIVEAKSLVLTLKDTGGECVAWISTPKGWKVQPGESVCVEGVCSTVQELKRRAFKVIYMSETLRRSTLGRLRRGDPVNLERSLTLASLIGGHLIQGHVDTTARIRDIRAGGGGAKTYAFSLPPRFLRYIVEKGSVAVDGVSLTVVKAGRAAFTVSLLDYTLQRTTFGGKTCGDLVNIEVDILAKYVERLLAS
ncbi:MAG: riboflavin synthase [Terriglobia bacterium]